MKKKQLCVIWIVLGLVLVMSVSGNEQSLRDVEITDKLIEQPQEAIVTKPIQYDLNIKYIEKSKLTKDIIDMDIQIPHEPASQPSIVTDNNGNPFVAFQSSFGLLESNIWVCQSSDGGTTWPEDSFLYFESETLDKNPDVCLLDDKIQGFATYENGFEEPRVDVLHFVDISDPTTWLGWFWDTSNSGSYVKETAITCKGDDVLAVASIRDYSGDSGNFYDTLYISWTVDPLFEDGWQGVYWLNEDNEGNSIPRSHIAAASGEKTFIVYESKPIDGPYKIYTTYAKLNETSTYLDWKSTQISSSRGNATHPHITVSGDTAYVVYSYDQSGNQDVYCAVSSSGNFWRKYPVVTSEDDELFPVIYAEGENLICMYIKNNNLFVCTSEDGGISWNEPTMVNDVEGSIIESYSCMDIDGAAGVWTDDRSDETALFIDTVGSAPLLVTSDISGGFGCSIIIENLGTADAIDIPYIIDIEGLVVLGAHSEGVFTVSAGTSTTIQSGLLFAFGKITITVSIGDIKKTASAFAIGPLILSIQN